jgi:hypothetical protein
MRIASSVAAKKVGTNGNRAVNEAKNVVKRPIKCNKQEEYKFEHRNIGIGEI